MAGKVLTWLGEDDLHFSVDENEHGELEHNPAPGPSFMFWARVRFDKGKPVLIDPDQAPTPDLKLVYEHILKKAPKMKEFTVEDVPEGVDGEAHEGEGDDDGDETVVRKPRHQAVPKRRR